jgi:hypothetical protein
VSQFLKDEEVPMVHSYHVLYVLTSQKLGQYIWSLTSDFYKVKQRRIGTIINQYRAKYIPKALEERNII